jgi:hypothetical protein
LTASRGRKPTIVAGAFGLTVCVATWILPILLTYPSVGLTPSERLQAINDTRQMLGAVVLAAGAVGTVIFTARTYSLSRESHVTDRIAVPVKGFETRAGLFALDVGFA